MSRTYNKKGAAERYDSARALPAETAALWMDTLEQLVPAGNITRILDLGGGTGRFTGLLRDTYRCPVIILDPSVSMLGQGRESGFINGVCGAAEHMPLRTCSVDMVFMSQVYHHLEDRRLAFSEIHRVLKPQGYFALRNATRENNIVLEWIKFYPEAKQIEDEKIPTEAEIIDSVPGRGFEFIKLETVYQLFARSYAEYYDKISKRGLSSLISISDEAFNAGLARFRKWIEEQPGGQPAYEPLDIFIFRKRPG